MFLMNLQLFSGKKRAGGSREMSAGGRRQFSATVNEIVREHSIEDKAGARQAAEDVAKEMQIAGITPGNIADKMDENAEHFKNRRLDARVDAAVDRLIDRIRERTPDADEAAREFTQIRKAVADRPLYMAAQDRHDIPDFRQYSRSSENRIKFTNNRRAVSVDTAYHQLQERYPHHFGDDARTPSDQVKRINAVLGQLRNRSRPTSVRNTLDRHSLNELRSELKLNLISAYLAGSI